ncbi:MAG: ISAs1 family transposase [Candidatus Aminicenantes bacterium]|nr:ISAs1 family transposase [Candidatus Aminicenantes bacterium]
MGENSPFDRLEVRPIRAEEVSLWGEYLKRYHYLGYKSIPGKFLRYIATIEKEWVALIGWGSPALKCSVRDRFIGWDYETKLQRLYLIINNVRFLILPWIRISNLASKVLSLNAKRISADFQRVYGHPVYLAETFVDISRYKGTCYKAANWRYVGLTSGYSKSGDKYYKTDQRKAVYLYPLHRKATELLSADFIPYDFNLIEEGRMSMGTLNLPVEGLIEEIKKITDPRKARGIRYPLHTVLGIAVCAVMFGARSYRAIGDWASGISKDNLKRFGSKRGKAPSEPSIRRVIQRIDVDEFDAKVGMWLIQVLRGKAISMDGKTLRGSGKHLLSAVVHKEGIVVAQKDVSEKTNEITRVKPLFKDLDIEHSVVTGDALLTQKEIARYLKEEKNADYLFTVKGNQQTLFEDIRDLELKKNAGSQHDRKSARED